MAIASQKGMTLYTVTATTDASGDCTAYTDEPIIGLVHSIQYVKTDYTNGVDFTITGETSGISMWTDTNVNASEVVTPIVAASLNTDGSAIAGQYQMLAMYGERMKFVIGSGGASKVGTFKVLVLN